MPGFAHTPACFMFQIVASLLLIGVTAASAYGWVGRQDPRKIEPAPVTYFLGRFGWRPLMWFAFLLVMLPTYREYQLNILGLTHISVTGLYWIQRMIRCGKWRSY
jgi:hypothetical protein